jgi:hypothetical protein
MLTLAPPKIPWHVQVLTLDYLVDGYIDGSHDKAYFRTMANVLYNISLANVHFQSTGNQPVPARDAAAWAMLYGEQLVALIPWDEASLATAMQSNVDYKIATQGEVYVGCYLIRGAVLSYDANLSVFGNQRSFPVQNAEITCRLPGAQWSGLKAPYLLVMSQHKQLVIAD